MICRVRLVVAALAAALAFSSVPSPAAAFAPRHGRHKAAAHAEVEATPAARVHAALRQRADVATQVPGARQHAWAQFRATAGTGWAATWDRATGVPSRLWGDALWIPGSSASADLAAYGARWFLEQHLELLAPGVSIDELELVSNHDDGTMRTIGFVQRHDGLRVVGGQISVRIKNDRLFVVSSQILPDVAVAAAPTALARADLRDRVRVATARDLDLARADAGVPGEPVIVPLLSDDAVLGYRVAVPVEIDGGGDGRWLVYADPGSGEPLVRHSQVRWASGTVLFDVPVRYPSGGRADYPAVRAQVVIGGNAATTAGDGVLSWSPDQPVSLVTSVVGDLVAIETQAGDGDDPPEVTGSFELAPDGTVRWSEADDGLADAQLTSFVHTQIAKAYARNLVTDPRTMAFLDEPMAVIVNINDECNAFYTEGKIHFFQASTQCENTGRLADVVYHEFGHGLHDFSVIEGVGLFDGAMSEGAADFLSASITGDPGMGRGFFFNDEALRDLDEPDRERVWPDDVGEVHATGVIFGGAFWDLRKVLIAGLGEAEGIALTERLFIASLQRATDIPSSLIEVLAADDDNGTLADGTPHECMIREAFGRHGLRTVTATVVAPGKVAGTDGETTAPVEVAVQNLSALCPGDEVDHVVVRWGPRDGSASPERGEAMLTAHPVTVDTWEGVVPLPEPGDVSAYHATVVFSDGTSMQFPDNRGDPDYELYRGEVIELYCTDFERDPFEDGWSHDAASGDDAWQWGPPLGLGADPSVAFSGDNVVGQALTDGLYQPDLVTALRSPVIDVDHYSDVRLHFRRWLGVEDALYDQATIYANGEIAWKNFDSGPDDGSAHTRDKEWVFRDVSLSTRIYDGTVQLTFELKSDQGLEFGGWTMDDLCIVADPDAICGDGTINGLEQCDLGDGNADQADTCRSNCRVARCGDAIVDSAEECDDGNLADGDTCSRICQLPGDDGGCCSSTDDPTGALAPLGLLGLGLLLTRRRRRGAARA